MTNRHYTYAIDDVTTAMRAAVVELKADGDPRAQYLAARLSDLFPLLNEVYSSRLSRQTVVDMREFQLQQLRDERSKLNDRLVKIQERETEVLHDLAEAVAERDKAAEDAA